ncbi:MAG: hypothetical protein ACREQ7_21070 [Candidatus Binatia bacterium]
MKKRNIALRSKDWRTRVRLVSAVFVLWAAIAAAQEEKIPREVSERAASEGTVLVLVGLNVPWRQEETLSDDAVLAQRQAIRSAQNKLLSELSGTRHSIIRQYEVIPGIALEVGSDALAALEKSVNVSNVVPDRPARPSSGEGSSREGPQASRSDDEGRNDPAIVPAELFKEAAGGGTVLVLVGLKAPWRPEGPLSERLVSAQREAISAAQDYLLVELAGTQHKITRRYRRIPGIALEVGLDALQVLARSRAVTNVLPDRPARPQSGGY